MANSMMPRQLSKELASLRKQVNQLEASQKRQTERLTAQMARAFKDAPVGLCYFDAELRYVQINDYLAKINGLPVEEHIGKTVIEVLPEIAAAGVEKELRKVRESGDPVIQGIVTAETPAHPEERHTFMHDYHAVRSNGGDIIGVSCCVLDITDLRWAEHERDEQIRETEAFNKTVNDRTLLDLKREINELCERFGIKPRYDVPFDENRDSTPPNKAE